MPPFSAVRRAVVCGCLAAAACAAGAGPIAFSTAPLSLPPAVYLGAAAAGDRVVVVGERGTIRFSEDGLRTWTTVPAPTAATLTSVRFADNRVGWICGHDEIILKSVDEGTSWSLAHGGASEKTDARAGPLFDILPLASGRVLAVGAYGVVLRSADGGKTWDRSLAIPGRDLHLYSLAQEPNGGVLCAVETGKLYRSSDFGKTWRSETPPQRGSFFGAALLGDGGVLLYGLRGQLTWAPPGRAWATLRTLEGGPLTCAAVLGHDAVLLGGAGGRLVRARPGAGLVETRTLPTHGDIQSMLALDDDHVLIFSDGEAAVHSIARDFGSAP